MRCEEDVVIGAHDGARETLGIVLHMLLRGLSRLNNFKNK